MAIGEKKVGSAGKFVRCWITCKRETKELT